MKGDGLLAPNSGSNTAEIRGRPGGVGGAELKNSPFETGAEHASAVTLFFLLVGELRVPRVRDTGPGRTGWGAIQRVVHDEFRYVPGLPL